MRRFLVLAFCSIAVFAGLGARASTTSIFSSVATYYGYGDVDLGAFSTSDPTGQNPPFDNGCVTIRDGSSSDSGCGSLHVEMAPGALAGRITGTVQGTLAPIAVDLVFAVSSVSDSPPPSYSVWAAPTDPLFVQAVAFTSSRGFVAGTVTSAFGSKTVTQVAQAYHGLAVVS